MPCAVGKVPVDGAHLQNRVKVETENNTPLFLEQKVNRYNKIS